MEKLNNIPFLRFPEFKGDWEKKKLGEVAEITTGSTPSTMKYEYYNGNKLFVSPADIQGNRYVVKTKTTLTEVGFSKGRKINKGSVLFVCIGSTIGKVAIANEECLTNQQINSLNGKNNFNNDFIFTLLEKNGSEIKLLAGVQAVPLINKTNFSNLIYSFPSLQEQTKIATFLTAVDNKLQALKQKKKLLEQYKKGVMQKIFSQELRFKDDNGNDYPDWEETKLGEILIEKNEKTSSSGQHRILSSTAKGIFNQDEYFTRDIASKDNTGYKILRKYQLVFSPQNLWLGNINVNMNFEIGIVSPSYKIFSFEEKFTIAEYCQYFLLTPKMMFEYEQSSTQGASVVRRNLDMDKFLSIEFLLPSIGEQTKIANFLLAIDVKINHCQLQVEKMEVWKKGLLQQMFC